jgi:hypothetical protein
VRCVGDERVQIEIDETAARVAHLAEQVAGVFGRAAVDPDGDFRPGAREVAHPATAGAEPPVGVETASHADTAVAEPLDLASDKWGPWANHTPLKSHPHAAK